VTVTTNGAFLPTGEGRRQRLLTVVCLAGAGVDLLVIAVQVLLHRMPPSAMALRLPLDVVLLAAPLVRRWTGSVRVAAMLVGLAVALAFPVIALHSGGLADPMIVIVPLIPLLGATFWSRGGTLFMGAALAAGLVVVAVLGRAQQAGAPELHADIEIRLAILGACLGLGVLIGYLHERERASMEANLRRLAERLQEESIRDSLTKVYNRRHLDERLPVEMAFARRHGTALSVIMLDVDHFKAVNDRHGHNAGDEVLTSIAGQMRRCMRVEDLLARFGGEEFAVVLRTTDVAAAHLVAERLRRTVEASPVRLPGIEIRVTISAGCSALVETRAETPGELLAAADRRLYAAKQAGRNRVVSGLGNP
jgi:diguanylate cyclase (GGDEF)-like protein